METPQQNIYIFKEHQIGNPRAAPILPATWAHYEGEICDLYINQDMTCTQVQVALASQAATDPTRRNFAPSVNQLQKQFKVWGWRKYDCVSSGNIDRSNASSSSSGIRTSFSSASGISTPLSFPSPPSASVLGIATKRPLDMTNYPNRPPSPPPKVPKILSTPPHAMMSSALATLGVHAYTSPSRQTPQHSQSEPLKSPAETPRHHPTTPTATLIPRNQAVVPEKEISSGTAQTASTTGTNVITPHQDPHLDVGENIQRTTTTDNYASVDQKSREFVEHDVLEEAHGSVLDSTSFAPTFNASHYPDIPGQVLPETPAGTSDDNQGDDVGLSTPFHLSLSETGMNATFHASAGVMAGEPDPAPENTSIGGFPSSHFSDFDQQSTHSDSLGDALPLSTYSLFGLTNRRLAAEYLLSIGAREQAFPLFLEEFHETRNHPYMANLPEWHKSLLSLACARSAYSISQMQQAERLAAEIGPDLESSALFEIELAYRRFNIHGAGVDALGTLLAEQESVLSSRFTSLPLNDRSSDFLTYFHISRNTSTGYHRHNNIGVTRGNGVSSSRVQVRDTFLQTIPGPFQLLSDDPTLQSFGNPCLLAWMRWSKNQLQSALGIFVDQNTALDFVDDVSNAKAIGALHAYLWALCYKAGGTGIVFGLAYDPRESMGLSGSELLAILCRLIWRNSQLPVGDDSNIVFRARDGAESLFLQREEQIGRQFLDVFCECNTLKPYSNTMLQFHSHIQEIGKHFVEDRLGITLPRPQDVRFQSPDDPGVANSAACTPGEPITALQNISKIFWSGFSLVAGQVSPTIRSNLSDMISSISSSVASLSSSSSASLASGAAFVANSTVRAVSQLLVRGTPDDGTRAAEEGRLP